MTDHRHTNREDVPFGKYDPSKFDSTGTVLLVNEIFYSLQGEGGNAGKAAVFIRLAKCNLACRFCDTEFEAFTAMTVPSIVRHAVELCPTATPSFNPGRPNIILTGGEPALQNCGPLIEALKDAGFKGVCIETNGSVYKEWMQNLWHICVSPKVHRNRMPHELVEIADEFKWIVNATFKAQYDRDVTSVFVKGSLNYLQPESQSPQWTQYAIDLVKQYPNRYTLSLQTHKIVNIP